ncbi:hypothetical protein [Helicobacter burdigaliensis]|uniref:hypothetical protein n=1 Tax=Helicobacter burdigaliensis TaxID=2315334 RepID=UPI000EF672A2|nr:hypothetical protein [Helicobacter burdigaliensis]
MKKIVLGTLVSFALSATLFAGGIDTKSAKIEFEGYKTPAMVGTKGSFKSAKYTFGKDASSLKGQLEGAKAVISPKEVDMGENNEIITTNIIETFFKTLNDKGDIKVMFKNVVEGDNKGVISAKITINKQSTTIPLIYTIEGDKFVAKGQLDLHHFSNSVKALKALSDVAPGHQNISWSVVDITFSANMQK